MKKLLLNAYEERTLRCLLFAVAIFNVLDYLLTEIFLLLGYRELNPVIDLFEGTLYFPLLKLVIIPLSLYFVWWLRHGVGKRILYYTWFTFGAYLSLMVYFVVHLWRFNFLAHFYLNLL